MPVTVNLDGKSVVSQFHTSRCDVRVVPQDNGDILWVELATTFGDHGEYYFDHNVHVEKPMGFLRSGMNMKIDGAIVAYDGSKLTQSKTITMPSGNVILERTEIEVNSNLSSITAVKGEMFLNGNLTSSYACESVSG
jgi:hypothetical protein